MPDRYSDGYMNKLHRLTERDRLAHYFALFGGLGLRLGYLATSGRCTCEQHQSDEISRVSRVLSEI